MVARLKSSQDQTTKLSQEVKVVLSGSGSVYPAHVGALEALVYSGRRVSRICGVSGGAVVASAFGAGYTAGDRALRRLILQTLPSEQKLIDWSWWPFNGYGLIKGNRILEMLRRILPPTFKELKLPVDVVVVDLEAKEHVVFNPETTPEADLPLVVRASMSIPLVFSYVEMQQRLFVDGGVAANFPLDIYGTGEDVIGFRVRHEGEGKPINGFVDYIINVVDTMLEASVREHMEDAVFARTVNLKTKGSGLNFNLTRQEVERLMDEARDQTKEALEQVV